MAVREQWQLMDLTTGVWKSAGVVGTKTAVIEALAAEVREWRDGGRKTVTSEPFWFYREWKNDRRYRPEGGYWIGVCDETIEIRSFKKAGAVVRRLAPVPAWFASAPQEPLQPRAVLKLAGQMVLNVAVQFGRVNEQLRKAEESMARYRRREQIPEALRKEWPETWMERDASIGNNPEGNWWYVELHAVAKFEVRTGCHMTPWRWVVRNDKGARAEFSPLDRHLAAWALSRALATGTLGVWGGHKVS